MTRKYPFGQTLLDVSTVCAIFWAVALFRVEYVGLVAVAIAAFCGVLWLVLAVRDAFTFGSRYAADFVAGMDYLIDDMPSKRKKSPLMIDAEYASIVREIEKARAKHAPRKHLYAKRDARLAQMLEVGE